MSTIITGIGFCPTKSGTEQQTGVAAAATPVSFPLRWLLLGSKYHFCALLSRKSEKDSNAAFLDTSSVSLTADSFPSRGSPWLSRSSSLPLEGKPLAVTLLKPSPRGEALGCHAPQAFPLRGRWPSIARPDEVEKGANIYPGHLPYGGGPKRRLFFLDRARPVFLFPGQYRTIPARILLADFPPGGPKMLGNPQRIACAF